MTAWARAGSDQTEPMSEELSACIGALVIPANAGMHSPPHVVLPLDPRVRADDEDRRNAIGSRSHLYAIPTILFALFGSLSASYSATLSKSDGIEIYLDGAQGAAAPSDKSQGEDAESENRPEQKTRLFCVRTCDGYYFPLDLPRDASRPADADSACRSVCPGAEIVAYYRDGDADSIEQARTLDLEYYGSLKHAYSYRTTLTAACGCRRPASLTDSILTDPTLRKGDIVATSEGLVVFRGYENTNQLEKNFSPVRSEPVPAQFEAEIRNIDRQYPDASGQSSPIQIISDLARSQNGGIRFVDEPATPTEDH